MSEILERQLLLQRSIERTIENFKNLGKTKLTASRIRTRIAALKDTWKQFQDGHVLMLKSVPAGSRATMDYFKDNLYDALEETYQAAREHLSESLEEVEPVVSQNHSFDNSGMRPDAAAISLNHLPHIKLPPFDGNYSEWESFRDRFTSLIIENKSVSDFARMHYLVSSLKGRALDTLSDIAITADNFPIAWETLSKRFENTRRLLASHFSTLLELSVVNKESASELQTLFDKIKITIASLKNLNRTPSELWDDILVY